MAAILMTVLSTGSPTADDTWAIDRLDVTLGHDVTPVNSSAAVPANIADYDLLVFGPSTQNNQTSKWDSVAINVLSLDAAKLIHQKISTQNFASGGSAITTRWLISHEANNGLTGSMTIYPATPSTGYKWYPSASIASSAVKTAYHDNSLSRVTGLVVESGTVLNDGAVCPSRRALLPFHEFGTVNATGISLFDSYVTWVLPETSSPSPISGFRSYSGASLPVTFWNGTDWQ